VALLLAVASAAAEPPPGQPGRATKGSDSQKAQPDREAASLEQARASFEQGRAAYRSGQLKAALAHFRRAYQLAPSTELDFDLARIYERVGEPAAAMLHLRAYLSHATLADDERPLIEARIRNLEALQARQQAQLIEAAPTSTALTAEARAFFERGKKLFREGRYEAALAAFAAAQRFSPLPELSYNLAVISERLGRASDAIDYYRAYLRDSKAPADAEAVQARIRTLLTDRSPRRATR
jgi:tetratricopeptide (TPR) repeat protein